MSKKIKKPKLKFKVGQHVMGIHRSLGQTCPISGEIMKILPPINIFDTISYSIIDEDGQKSFIEENEAILFNRKVYVKLLKGHIDGGLLIAQGLDIKTEAIKEFAKYKRKEESK